MTTIPCVAIIRFDMGESTKLSKLREKIDSIDRNILELLNDRGALAIEVSKLKQQNSFDLYHPGREREIEDKITSANPGPLPDESVLAVFREIISSCRALQSPLRVAFLGPEGSYSHQAAFKEFGAQAELTPERTIDDVFREVERARAVYGIVPVENSAEGSLGVVLDMFLDSELLVSSEVYLRINHCLMSQSGNMDDVRTIASHQQALAQCRMWLTERAPGRELLESPSTTNAALMAKEGGEVAAVAGELAASIYDLQIIEKHIEDSSTNTTRFWVIGKTSIEPTESDKTSIMFSLRDEPGALNKTLTAFSKAGVNLTKIESRPSRKRPWEYVFYVDFVGHHTSPEIEGILSEMRGGCIFLKILGSYPMGRMD